MDVKNERPNIVWICTDQQRYDTIGLLGNPYVNTPNIDQLVRSGVAFENAYCQTPICTPSRASFLTGMYPSSVHACLNGNDYWADAMPLLPKILSDAGYDCGLVGKLHLAGTYNRKEPRKNDGYRYFKWSSSPIDMWQEGHDYSDWLKGKGFSLKDFASPPDGDNYIGIESGIPAELHQSTWCAEKAVEFIEHEAVGPWFLSVNPYDPHPPFNPPQEYLDHYPFDEMPGPLFRESDLKNQELMKTVDFQTQARNPEEFNAKALQAAYYAMIELIDVNVGKILNSLKKSGNLENTIVIFMSDHGEALGDHGLLLKGCRFYEGLIKVPLILSSPGRFLDDVRSNALVQLNDIMPTLLDACNIEIPECIEGKSLYPLLTGKKSLQYHRETARCEYYRALNPDWRPNFEGSYGTMIRDQRYKLSIYHGHKEGELYDLEQDPGEFENLWESPAHSDVKFELMKRSFDELAFAVDLGPKQTVRW
jgi:arylsulfatase A-like enzyme